MFKRCNIVEYRQYFSFDSINNVNNVNNVIGSIRGCFNYVLSGIVAYFSPISSIRKFHLLERNGC